MSGTVSVTYKGNPVPTAEINIFKQDDWLGHAILHNPPANTPWSVVIPAFTSDTEISISPAGYKGNVVNGAEQLFMVNEVVKRTVKNTSVSGIAVNLIEVSGTISVTYKGNPVPTAEINIIKQDDWLGHAILHNPPANAPWTVVIPAFTSDTEISISPAGYKGNEVNGAESVFWVNEVAKRTVKNTSVSGIVLNLGNITN